jgi:hypothetical protein
LFTFRYGRGDVTEKGDVYSFGVVLLELMTGRPAVSKEGVSLVQWAVEYMHREPEYMEEIIDPRLEVRGLGFQGFRDEGEQKEICTIEHLENAVAVGYMHRKPRVIDPQLLGKEVWDFQGFWKAFERIQSRNLLEGICGLQVYH